MHLKNLRGTIMGSESFKANNKSNDFVDTIFKQKKEFHQKQALLPIEEKVRILIELQKIALTIRPRVEPDDKRMIWEIR